MPDPHRLGPPLLDSAGQLLRVLFLDREGHLSAQPHYVSKE